METLLTLDNIRLRDLPVWICNPIEREEIFQKIHNDTTHFSIYAIRSSDDQTNLLAALHLKDVQEILLKREKDWVWFWQVYIALALRNSPQTDAIKNTDKQLSSNVLSGIPTDEMISPYWYLAKIDALGTVKNDMVTRHANAWIWMFNQNAMYPHYIIIDGIEEILDVEPCSRIIRALSQMVHTLLGKVILNINMKIIGSKRLHEAIRLCHNADQEFQEIFEESQNG